MADPTQENGPATNTMADTTITRTETTTTATIIQDAPDEAPAMEKVDHNGKDTETATAVSDESAGGGGTTTVEKNEDPTSGPVVSSSKKTRPPYRFDPDRITLRFLFANRDGLTVTIECNPGDTVGEVKGSLMSVWPEGIPQCKGGDQIRLVCMGKGYLMPDSRTLGEFEIPVFKTHPTPINVALRPDPKNQDEEKTLKKKDSNNTGNSRGTGRSGQSADSTAHQNQASQGCSCAIL